MTVSGFAFYQNANNANPAEISPLEDQTIFIAGNDVRVPEGYTDLVLAAKYGTNPGQSFVDSPMIRTLSKLWLSWQDGGDEPASLYRPNSWIENPVKVNPGEGLNFYSSNTGGAAVDHFGAVWLADSPVNPVGGANIRTVRGTTDFTSTAHAWSAGQITLSDDLPGGRYNVLGFKVQATTGVLARLIFPRQGMRPMVPCYDGVNDQDAEIFRGGRLGVLGNFENFVPPKLELLSTGADQNPIVYLDVAKVA